MAMLHLPKVQDLGKDLGFSSLNSPARGWRILRTGAQKSKISKPGLELSYILAKPSSVQNLVMNHVAENQHRNTSTPPSPQLQDIGFLLLLTVMIH